VKFPSKIEVEGIVSSRYGEITSLRPANWEERVRGVDIIRTKEGNEIRLLSEADQSTPQKNWVLMLTGEVNDAFVWTLYGMPRT